MIRLTHVINNLQVGGAETMLLRLAQHIDRAVCEMRVISLIGDGPIGEDLRRCGIDVQCLGARRGLAGPGLIGKLGRAIAQSETDIIQSWLYHSNLLSLLARRRAGSPPVCWNVRHSLHAMKQEKWLTRRVIRAGARLSGRVDAIIFNSHVAMKQHQAIGYDNDRMQVIQNGLDPTLVAPVPGARAALRHKLGIDDGSFLIGCVGRLHPDKNQQLLVEAVNLLVGRGVDVHCLLVGRGCEAGGDAEKLRGQGALKGRLHLMGEQRPVTPLLSGLDCLALPSRGESFPNVLVEAMACGIPCVSTDVGDAAMILKDSDRISPPMDAVALSTSIAKVSRMSHVERTRLGNRDQSSIIQRFPVERMLGQYELLWTDMIAGRNSWA